MGADEEFLYVSNTNLVNNSKVTQPTVLWGFASLVFQNKLKGCQTIKFEQLLLNVLLNKVLGWVVSPLLPYDLTNVFFFEVLLVL